MLGVISAVGGTVQVLKTLYEYYDLHKKNKAVLDILDGFTHNLSISIERLKVREQLMIGKANPALESIEKDFVNAGKWLHANDKNLKSVWTTLQACDKLKDLDARLTKSFASKFSVALFMALQDVRQATQSIETKIDTMGASIDNLESVCREATRSGLQEAIKELKEEAFQVSSGREKGFIGGEAEKIISALVDRLSEQDRLKEEEERTGVSAVAGPSPAYQASISSNVSSPFFAGSSLARAASPYSRSGSLTVAYQSNLRRALTSRSASAFLPEAASSSTSAFASLDRSSSISSRWTADSDSDQRTLETDLTSLHDKASVPFGGIIVMTKDPHDQRDMIDPVLASDGLVYDRWTLIEHNLTNTRDTTQSLVILGDLVQLREAIYDQFPARRSESHDKRQAYREETLNLYQRAEHADMWNLINKLSHCLLWEPTSVLMRVRRAVVRFRVRDLGEAKTDLNEALKMTSRDKDHLLDTEQRSTHVDLEILRIRALVNHETNAYAETMSDVNAVLARSPHDVLALCIRSCLRSAKGDLKGAQADLALANESVAQDKAFQSSLSDCDSDLDFVARGWAYANIRDFASAAKDFQFALTLRSPTDPYISACLASAQIQNEVAAGQGDMASPVLIQAFSALDSIVSGLSSFARALKQELIANGSDECARWSSGPLKPEFIMETWTRDAYPVLFLRGGAFYNLNDFEAALSDFELGLKLRPASVQDTGPFRALLAEMRVENGKRSEAAQVRLL
ncbi:hypothetical protein OIO90_005238 [Microbotryomycetes sp. JL221]|nr:hypothetical protein OIO90_005238 [Microbotryomycetes sp. JL221]